MSYNNKLAEILNAFGQGDDEIFGFKSAEESRGMENKLPVSAPSEARTTSRTFQEIDSNSRAQQLGKNTRKQQPSAKKGSGPSGGTAAVKKEHFVDLHRLKLIERVSNISPLLDRLLQKKVLHQEQYDEVYAMRPTQKQMRFLYNGPLKASKKSKDVFLSVLKKLEPYLIQDLRKKKESSTKANFANNCTSEPGPSTKSSTKGPKKPQNVKSVLQYGKHEGKSFKWLLKNDSSFVVSVVGDYQQQTEDGKTRIVYKENKDALAEFVTKFPEVVEQVKIYRGLTPLGFGKYKEETHQALYDSEDKEKQSYVKFLRGQKTTVRKGSQMEVAINYILRRDKERPVPPFTSADLQKRKSTKKRSNPGTKSKPDAKKQKLN